ncbi:MAG: hypothetical protein J5I53_11360 [Bradyrhizobiaceae bacterium]|nr:hypothetical protein [Bradyrhizobiaceae bacterium]
MSKKPMRAHWLLTAAVGAAMVLTSCTCMIKEEQQAMINQLRTDEKQLTADIAKAETNKSKLLSELNGRQAEVRKCNEKRAFAQEKMAKWPSVWGDWNPSEPAVMPTPPPSSTKKK